MGSLLDFALRRTIFRTRSDRFCSDGNNPRGSGWSLLFIWSVSFVWLNQTDQAGQMNQINPRPLSRVRSFHMLQLEIVEVGDGIRLGP